MEDGLNDSALPLPHAGGDRGVGPRSPHAIPTVESVKFRLERPTERARELRNDPTAAERLLWSRLCGSRLDGLKFTRQLPIAGHFADFACRKPKLVIELDGSQHVDAAEADAERTRRMERAGYRVIRFWNNDLTSNMGDVLEEILAAATACGWRGPTPQPPPARGRGSRTRKRGAPE
jgi:very-short-patch-repair endonuclease